MIDGDEKIEHPMAERLREAKRVLRRAKADAGVDYQEIADSLKRSVNIVYRMLDMRDNIHHLRLGDVLEMSRATCTAVRVFAHMAVAPIVEGMAGHTVKAGACIASEEITSMGRVLRIVVPVEHEQPRKVAAK